MRRGRKRGAGVDASDLLLGAGLLLLGGGIWWLNPPLALMTVGAVLFGLGVLLSWARSG